jgi:hypothetical protein
MRDFAGLDDAALAGEWRWRDGRMRVRDALYRSLEEEQDALVRARAAWQPTEAERILALAQRAFGDLRGLLVGVEEVLLDREPAPGEWTLRVVLRHALLVERRYAVHVAYGAHRRDAEPVQVPEERLPTERDVDASGDVDQILARLGAARAQTDALCGVLPPAALSRPTRWGQFDVDLRFRLHRFAAHLVEHTIQCEKTLEALGARQSEARRIVRRIWATRGELEATGDDAALTGLDQAHRERALPLLNTAGRTG